MPSLLAVVQIANHTSVYLPALHGCWCHPLTIAFTLSPHSLLLSHLHSYRTLITLNLRNLRCNYQKSPLLHKQFLIFHSYMHYFTETSMLWCILTMTAHVSLTSLCQCHCWHCTLPTVTLNHYTMLLCTIANGIQVDIAMPPSLTPVVHL